MVSIKYTFTFIRIWMWRTALKIPLSQFRKPLIKKSKLCDLTYKGGHGKGTCNIIYEGKEIAYFTRKGWKYISDTFGQ